MAQVRAIRLCQIDNALRQEGEVFEYNGPHNGNVEYIDGKPQEAAPAAVEAEALAPAVKKWKKAKPADDAAEGSA